jgi:hypothetical protein
MAEIRISAGDLRKIDHLARSITADVKKIDARTIEKIGTDVAGALNAHVSRVLANIDKIQARLGVTDPATQRRLRSGLEGLEGATGAVEGVAPFAALLTKSPQARIALLAASALLGGAEGLGRDGMRRAAIEARRVESEFADATWRRLDAFDREIARLKAAHRRARRPS